MINHLPDPLTNASILSPSYSANTEREWKWKLSKGKQENRAFIIFLPFVGFFQGMG